MFFRKQADGRLLRFGSQFYSLDATFVPGGGIGFNDSFFLQRQNIIEAEVLIRNDSVFIVPVQL